MNPLFLLPLCAAVAWCSGHLAYRALKMWHVLDVPNARSSHDEPVVRGGGLAVLAAVLAGAAVWAFLSPSSGGGWLLLAALLMVAGISLWDDVVGVRSSVRFTVHALAAGLALWALWTWGNPRPETLPWGVFHGSAVGTILLCAGGFVWIVGYTNAFNFMDGINGLAAGQSVVAGSFGAWFCLIAGGDAGTTLAVPGLILAGSALGFLPHNFPAARMFLGDVGSVPLGFLHALYVLGAAWALGWMAGLALFAMHLNFLLDTSITLVRRWRRGETLHEPHREHYYQRLHRSGISHAGVTGLEMILQVMFGLALAFALYASSPAVLTTVVAVVAAAWLVFFLWCEKKFQRSLQAGQGGAK